MATGAEPPNLARSKDYLMPMTTRLATAADAKAMDDVLTPILESWGSTRDRGADHIRAFYIDHPDAIACTLAQTDRVVGFQALKRATPGNVYDLPEGWGIIGTYVALDAPRCGIGRALFAASRRAAQQAGVRLIDATIGADNVAGLAYYEAMGFRDWRTLDGAIGKRYDL